jgi:hypothetical protein
MRIAYCADAIQAACAFRAAITDDLHNALRKGRNDLAVNALMQPDTRVGSVACRIPKDSLDRAVLFQRRLRLLKN